MTVNYGFKKFQIDYILVKSIYAWKKFPLISFSVQDSMLDCEAWEFKFCPDLLCAQLGTGIRSQRVNYTVPLMHSWVRLLRILCLLCGLYL